MAPAYVMSDPVTLSHSHSAVREKLFAHIP